MQLLTQPDNGIYPILKAIRKARKTIDIHVFRLDYEDVERALAAAVARGVVVRTLIAHTSRGGEKGLRKLEAPPEWGLISRAPTTSSVPGEI
jgi:phosphatidylserine/phosphatidylglycerophosphate/cardiolipin synthase-like enzyme